jgi:hypothetical protein
MRRPKPPTLLKSPSVPRSPRVPRSRLLGRSQSSTTLRRRINRRRPWWIALGLGLVPLGALPVWLIRPDPVVALSFGLAVGGWTLALLGLRRPIADLSVTAAMARRAGEELLTVRVVSRGTVPVTVRRIALAVDRAGSGRWWAAWHPLLSEIPGRPLHHGDGATFAIDAIAAAVAIAEPRWVLVEDTIGDLYRVGLPAYVRHRLGAIRDGVDQGPAPTRWGPLATLAAKPTGTGPAHRIVLAPDALASARVARPRARRLAG